MIPKSRHFLLHISCDSSLGLRINCSEACVFLGELWWPTLGMLARFWLLMIFLSHDVYFSTWWGKRSLNTVNLSNNGELNLTIKRVCQHNSLLLSPVSAVFGTIQQLVRSPEINGWKICFLLFRCPFLGNIFVVFQGVNIHPLTRKTMET